MAEFDWDKILQEIQENTLKDPFRDAILAAADKLRQKQFDLETRRRIWDEVKNRFRSS